MSLAVGPTDRPRGCLGGAKARRAAGASIAILVDKADAALPCYTIEVE
jgi:hypothetical protein